jgi:hypothetical protein
MKPIAITFCVLRALLLVLVIGPACAVPACAEVQNGDFESGDADWTVDGLPEGWSVDFPATGGNPDGHAVIRTTADGSADGMVCISQRFACGEGSGPSTCVIRYQVVFATTSDDLLSADLVVLIDDELASVVNDPGDWHSWSTMIPCGTHEIAFCLETFGASGGWTARFDNVSAECLEATDAEPMSWGRLKIHCR